MPKKSTKSTKATKAKKPAQIFYDQTVDIRYKSPRRLEVELDKVLGRGNWFATQVSQILQKVINASTAYNSLL